MRIKPRQSICARRPQHQARACGPARRSPQRHGSASSLDRSSAVRKSRRRDGDRPAPPPTQRDARASLCLCGGARADDHEIIGAHDLVSSSPVACVRALAAAAPSRPAGFGENDPRASAEGDIGPQPIERDDDARAEADEKINIGKDPKEPCEAAGERHPAKSTIALLRPIVARLP